MDIRPHDTVLVIKAGQVIPQILEVLTEKRPPESQPLNIEESLKAQNIPATIVANQWISADIEAQRTQQLIYYARTLRIENLGPALIKQLVHARVVTDAIDLYKLQEKTLCANTSAGPKLAKKIIANIQSTRQCRFKDWLAASGIPQIGPQTAAVIATNIKQFSDFVELPIYEDKLITQIGPRLTLNLLEWLEKNRDFFEPFADFEFQFSPRVVERLPLTGVIFVLTGKLTLITRNVAAERIARLGGKVQAQPSKKTRYVILGNAPSKAKQEKANYLHCDILDEVAFLDFLKTYETDTSKARE